MTTKVLKYELPIDGTSHGMTPGKIVHVAPNPHTQDSVLVWIEVRPQPAGQSPSELIVIGTGMSFNDEWEHVASIVDEPFVWHIYNTNNSPLLPPEPEELPSEEDGPIEPPVEEEEPTDAPADN